MNSSMVRVVLGHVMKIEGILLLLPCLVAAIYREDQGFVYLIVAVCSVILGSIFTYKKPEDKTLYLKEGCVATSLSWIVLSVIGALPFYITGEIPSYTDALFETISGFTTTGSSILEDIEALSHTALFWRSFTHWVGGMGVLVFLLSIVSLSGGSTINLMKAESPGPSVSKITPKIKSSARMLYYIYAFLTVLEAILLLLGGCPFFDAITTAFGTAGTGGFAVKGDSLASYSAYIQWVVTIFMIMFGINFNAYYFIFMKKIKDAFRMEEVRWYLGIVLGSIIIIFINIRNLYDYAGDALRDAAFQVAAIITTTGFATADFDTWNMTCKILLVTLMFVGACAGSTGGGMKVSRFILVGKTIGKEIRGYLHPKSVKKILFDGKPCDHEMMRSVNVYFMTYIAIYVISLFFISFQNEDFATTFTSVATCINNIGPGLNKLGPTCNFHFMSGFSKYVLMFDMLAGRLELFPLIIMMHPTLWKELIARKVRVARNKRVR